MSVRAGNAIALARGMVMAGGEDEAEDDGQGEQEMGCSAVQCILPRRDHRHRTQNEDEGRLRPSNLFLLLALYHHHHHPPPW